jgi:hypothetical protein
MHRRLILSLMLAAAAGPAFAAETKAREEPANGLYVDIAQVGLPVIVRGRLVNYVFTSVRLILSPGANVVALRTKEPYFRDALVRAAHRTPFTLPGDLTRLDEAALRRTLAVEAAKIAGPRAIAAVQVTSQTSQRRVVAPPG